MYKLCQSPKGPFTSLFTVCLFLATTCLNATTPGRPANPDAGCFNITSPGAGQTLGTGSNLRVHPNIARWACAADCPGNLLANPGFETGNLTGWTISPGTPADEAYLNSTAPGPFANVEGAYYGIVASYDDGTVNNMYQDIATSAGTTANLSVYAAVHNPNNDSNIKLQFLDASNAVLWEQVQQVDHDVDIDLSFQLYTFSGIAPANTVKTRVLAATSALTYTGGTSFKTDVWCLMLTPCPSGITLTTAPATCTGGTANNDGKITLTAISNADKYGISTGATYSGTPDYAAATAIGSLPLIVKTNVPNTGGTYTIRFFNGSDGCLKDTTVTVTSTTCTTTCPPPPGPPVASCADSTLLATPCYINGNPLGGSPAGDMDAFVVWNYNNSGDVGYKRALPAREIGSAWGTAYKQQNGTIYTSAFLKRHVGFGPSGIGAIYKIDVTSPTLAAVPFVDLSSLGIAVGTDTRTPSVGAVDNPNELSADPTMPSWDVDAFASIGKKSLGGLDVSSDGNTMWTVNLFNKELVKLDISGGSPTLLGTYPIANPGCSNNDYVPFAVKSYNGKTWIGITCTAETSQDANDLRAYVVAFNGSSFMPVYDFPLDYRKGYAGGVGGLEGDHWKPWSSTYQNLSTDPNFTIYPTPLLSDIEFDTDGSMMLAFMDRTAHQMGSSNYLPTFNSTTTSSVHSGGDLLRACNVGGAFALENNGLCPGEASRPNAPDGSSNSGENNTQGPGGGEYYWGEVWAFNPYQPNQGYHQETSFGAIAFQPGTNEVVLTVLDPTMTGSSGGAIKLSNTTGRKLSGFRLYQNTGGFPTFGKANGLGDIELFCAPKLLCTQPSAFNLP